MPLERAHAWLAEHGFGAAAPRGGLGKVVAAYVYEDASGKPTRRITKHYPKTFRQSHPDPNRPGAWLPGVKGVPLIPYRLPELLAGAGELVVIAEGEKDIDALAQRGFVATCNAGGAGKWPRSFAEYFAGRNVVILPDNDDAGRAHASLVAASLASTARSVRVPRRCPTRCRKADVLPDWLAPGGTAEELRRLAAEAPQYDPATKDHRAIGRRRLLPSLTAARRGRSCSTRCARCECPNGAACSAMTRSARNSSVAAGHPGILTRHRLATGLDHDDLLTATWLQENHVHVSPLVAAQAVEVIARENPFDPVKDYLSAPEMGPQTAARHLVQLLPWCRRPSLTFDAVGGRWLILGRCARLPAGR